jgi:ribosomal protein S15P/S13E
MIERPAAANDSSASKLRAPKAAASVDKNSRTIVKIMQLQQHLNESEKDYTAKDKAILKKICMY